MKCLVTGGAGFIGSNLVKYLLKQGLDVTVLDNLSTGSKRNLVGLPVRLVVGSILNHKLLDRSMAGVDTVFHLAASVGHQKSIEFPLQDAETNVQGTINVLEAVKKAGAKRLVYSSSAAIYGETSPVPITEDHCCKPSSPYGCTKLCAEKLCLTYAKLYGLGIVCLRYFNAYGVGQQYDTYGNVIPIFLARLQAKQPLVIYGDGEQTRDFVNVRDIARANLLAAQSKAVGAFNIGSGVATSINTLAKFFKGEVVHGPERPEVRHCVANISAARAAFNYFPATNLFAGLAEYACWEPLK